MLFRIESISCVGGGCCHFPKLIEKFARTFAIISLGCTLVILLIVLVFVAWWCVVAVLLCLCGFAVVSPLHHHQQISSHQSHGMICRIKHTSIAPIKSSTGSDSFVVQWGRPVISCGFPISTGISNRSLGLFFSRVQFGCIRP